MARVDIQFNLRVPAKLKAMVEDSAKVSGRSINAEAAYLLESGLSGLTDAPRKIIYNEYHGETIDESSKFLNDYFVRNPSYQLINVESLGSVKYKAGSIRFWYSYPADDICSTP